MAYIILNEREIGEFLDALVQEWLMRVSQDTSLPTVSKAHLLHLADAVVRKSDFQSSFYKRFFEKNIAEDEEGVINRGLELMNKEKVYENE